MDIEYLPFENKDIDLLNNAIELINLRYKYRQHHVSAAIRSYDGTIVKGLHMDTIVRRAAICAEAVVLGMAVTQGVRNLETIVAVRHSSPNEKSRLVEVVSPCGFCRELLMEYADNIKVIIDRGDGMLVKCKISDLLPHKYRLKHNDIIKDISVSPVYIDRDGKVKYD